MIFQFSKFSPKLLTYRWDTLYYLDKIQGPLNEWIEARFKLVQENGEKIWFEAVTSEDSTLGKEHKKLNLTH